MILCEYCGKPVHRTPRAIKITKHHFCCRNHYLAYREEHHYFVINKKSTYKMLVELSKQMNRNKTDIKEIEIKEIDT